MISYKNIKKNKLIVFFFTSVLLIIFFTLILNILNLNFSYFDLGLFIESTEEKTLTPNERYYFLYYFNNLFQIKKKTLGIFLIVSQYFCYLISFLYFYFNKSRNYFNCLYILNLNFLYALFFDFHFEFYLIIFILIFLNLKKNYLRFVIILLLPFIKDTFILISIGMIIYLYFINEKKTSFFSLSIFLVFGYIFEKNIDLLKKLSILDFFNIDLIIKKIFFQSLIILPFIFFLNKSILKNKIFIIIIPYFFFFFLHPNLNYLKFFYHYQVPVTFVFFYLIYKADIKIFTYKKIISYLIIFIQIIFSPLIGLPKSFLFKETNLYYKNILATDKLNYKDNIQHNDRSVLYVQNNVYSPLLYDHFYKIKVLNKDTIMQMSNIDYILLNQNKTFFLDDQKCSTKIENKKNSMCKKYYLEILEKTKVIEIKGGYILLGKKN
jgi:hypothetical protein